MCSRYRWLAGVRRLREQRWGSLRIVVPVAGANGVTTSSSTAVTTATNNGAPANGANPAGVGANAATTGC